MEPTARIKVLFAGFGEVPSTEIEMGLGQEDFEILRTKTGKETIDACISDPQLHFLILDVNMEDLNGFEITTYLRELGSNELTIIMFGWFSLASARLAYSVGCDEFISKPLDTNVLAGMLLHRSNYSRQSVH